MRRPLTPLLALAVLAGCAAPGTAPGANLSPQPSSLGGLTFKAVTAKDAPLLAGMQGASGSTSTGATSGAVPGPTQPVPAPAASTSPAGGAVSGNIYGSPYSYGYYFGGSPTSTPMALVSVNEAEAPGSRGPLKQILEAVVSPVLKDWAPDAILTSSNGTVGNDGLILTPSPTPTPYAGYYGGYVDAAWRLSYVSPSRSEMLNFTVAADRTVVMRMRWAPYNLASTPYQVDEDAAIAKLIATIKDPNAKSEEEKSGTDYFLGTAFTPAPTVAPPGYEQRVEVIYDVPSGARWNATLQQVLGKLVWDLSFFQQPDYAVKPQPAASASPAENFYLDNSGRGMIDAQTGAVIRFSRPSKRYYPTMPSAMPVPAPSATPETKPSPVPTPSPTP